MDFHSVFLAIGGLAMGVLGWFARILYQATQDLRKDLSALEIRITADYVRYDRLQDAMKPIMEKLNKIEEELHRRVTKP